MWGSSRRELLVVGAVGVLCVFLLPSLVRAAASNANAVALARVTVPSAEILDVSCTGLAVSWTGAFKENAGRELVDALATTGQWRYLGLIYLAFGDEERAQAMLARGAQRGDVIASEALAMLYARWDRWDAAASVLKWSSSFYANALFQRHFVVYHTERQGESLACLEIAARLAPEDYEIRLWRARMLEFNGRYEESIAESTVAMMLCPRCGVPYAYRSLARANSGHPNSPEVRADCLTAYQLEPKAEAIQVLCVPWLKAQGLLPIAEGDK